MVTIRSLQKGDQCAVMALAREVEPFFGRMAGVSEFEDGIRACLENGNGLCCEGPDGLEGVIITDKNTNAIEWFVVGSRSRGKGRGRLLLEGALSQLDRERDLTVQTFASHVPEGMAARSLYMKMGFTDFRDAGKNPAGVDTVLMVRKGWAKGSFEDEVINE
ncbi:GNAT family N-acetyltransferase [Desulfobotulus sp. H1]|uniref:GNAT family N-acetyltransferase n=1 Tax=Desulfobotulus pelophilus TaxID=2823377 RepID=A0ABT3N8B2_9BACT|nr:GNAT family N-acetyltransferase [Desulfobotulus pelophilus]MCW7753406.1 GNAT family N-acetyltransferase [Desulfobotulus pelophilus]